MGTEIPGDAMSRCLTMLVPEAGELHPGKKSYPYSSQTPSTESIKVFGLPKYFKLELAITSYMLS